MSSVRFSKPSLLYNTIACSALVLLFVYWPHVLALTNLSRTELPFKWFESIGVELTPHMPALTGRTTRFVNNTANSWPDSALVLPIIRAGRYEWWQNLVFFSSGGLLPIATFVIHLAFCAAVVRLWDRLLDRRVLASFVVRVTTIALISFALFPLCMSIGFGAHVVWAKVDWTFAWSSEFVGTRPLGHVSDSSLVAVACAGITSYIALVCFLFPMAAQTLALFEAKLMHLSHTCPFCGYSSQQINPCPECGKVSAAQDREGMHVANASRRFYTAGWVFCSITVVLVIAPIWLP